ncbi:YeiH family protein [Jannaschia formosa]|uniref:YeiH family protein n=1 Tax=Jannaschia formosa TaxID=2259592 RepID=UPI000E1C3C5E|nr:putative sulfate exporter family transporter [Jannaschia formosa]TFL18902.1 putative sulfate exporter family transporter [Jannaschia formosa]
MFRRFDTQSWVEAGRVAAPGLAVALLVAVAAQFVSEHYGAPAMLMALLFGIALNFLSEEGRCVVGIDIAARTILRLGVALLGFRVSMEIFFDLGVPVLLLVVLSVAATIAAGLLLAPLFGHGWRFGLLSAGSVAICGASAAIAIAAILPKDDRSEERLIFTIAVVTLLSTLAMVMYPIGATLAGLDTDQSGVFIGAAIHDVAQVVGAGFSVSDEAGEIATVVKLLRVALLAPVVFIAAIVIRIRVSEASGGSGPVPVFPAFILLFGLAALLNSLNVVPALLVDFATQASRWFLLTAIAAVGLKTSLARVLAVGPGAIALVSLETLFIGSLAFAGVHAI